MGLPDERDLIEALTDGLVSPRNRAGFASDCAIIPLDSVEIAATEDSFADRTHFPDGLSPKNVGRLAAGATLSDLASAGAEVIGAMVAYGVPPDAEEDTLLGIAEGIASTLERAGGEILGGDTKPRDQLTLTLAALGTCPRGGALLRERARPGDRFLVTGPLGGAGAALERIHDGMDPDEAEPLLPPDRTPAGVALREAGAHACMDLSDGLADAAVAIAEASEVAVHLEQGNVPLHPWAADSPGGLDHAMGTGGDYELAATVPEDKIEDVMEQLDRLGLEPVILGEVEAGSGARLETPEGSIELTRGYEHGFRES